VTEAADRLLRRLLRQARGWFSRHAERSDAVSVEADPREVQRWMDDTDHALLDEAADTTKGGAA
jgi:hypothetical protein